LQKAASDVTESDGAERSLADIREQSVFLRDNAAFVVQEVLDKFGETVPHGFIFFAYKERLHLLVQCDDECYETVKVVSEGLKRENRAINKFLVRAFSDAFESELWDDLVSASDTMVYCPISPEEL